MSEEDNLWTALNIPKKRVRELWMLWKELQKRYSEMSEVIKELEPRDDLTTIEKLALMYAVGFMLGMDEIISELKARLMAGEIRCA